MEERRASIGGFLQEDPKSHARAKNTLNKVVKYDGVWWKRKDYVKSLVGREDVQVYWDMGRWYFKFADEGSFLQVTKTEIDYYYYYYYYLLEKQN
ncbi:hypothetical protein [Bacillus sp. NEAU-Y102]